MLATQEARGRGFDLGIMRDTEGFVAEGATESVFMVEDGTLITPTLGTVLQAITRKSILEVAEQIGVVTAEERLGVNVLVAADELFVASTTRKITPIVKIEDRVMDAVPGPVTDLLRSRLADICRGRDPAFRHWLFPVL
jgi:branched-chain amino acid aminotransferase